MTTISNLSCLLLCLFSRKKPVFCTILPFYFGRQPIIFQAQLPAFYPQKSHFLTTISLFSDMFFVAREGFVYTIAADIYAFRPAFSGILHCVLHHFTLHLAPKRTAFSTKTHCV